MPESRRAKYPRPQPSTRPRAHMVMYITLGGMAVKVTRSSAKGKFKGALRCTINIGPFDIPNWVDAQDCHTAEYHLATDAYVAAEKVLGEAQG